MIAPSSTVDFPCISRLAETDWTRPSPKPRKRFKEARRTLGSYDPLTTFNVVEGEAEENASFHLREEKFARCWEYMLAIFKGQGKE
ncbi:hypothetical protein CO650_09685 [Rhizobium phaseoli]|nr:hypothetical protein CO650_09685 [Rhizobium phaseoli]